MGACFIFLNTKKKNVGTIFNVGSTKLWNEKIVLITHSLDVVYFGLIRAVPREYPAAYYNSKGFKTTTCMVLFLFCN